nr:immunoglobulin heavy chain junction region [Mus musculus]NSM05303.1 immunoglobulin heavy chain junction region [Mus musculus]NSM08937.1 immunoglobulin heavy chain junction region [Mus musculus]NSM09339.1 immunoglobulin heavy chain junction region [Mus musculus]NSM09631.1 immunoglobulin heavy chain junction region [Mus musculus]
CAKNYGSSYPYW